MNFEEIKAVVGRYKNCIIEDGIVYGSEYQDRNGYTCRDIVVVDDAPMLEALNSAVEIIEFQQGMIDTLHKATEDYILKIKEAKEKQFNNI